MLIAAPRFAHTSTTRIPVLTPMYGARHESLRAQIEGKYVCGSSPISDFPLTFPGAEAAHCCFVRESHSFSVTRLNGRVWVNDLPVNGMYLLDEGDVISFGSISFRLEYLDAPIAAPQHDYSSSSPYGFPVNGDRRAPAVPSIHSAPAIHSLPKSIEIHQAARPAIQDSSAQINLQKELLENQRLLSVREQQLDELVQIIRERERHAEARLAAIEERSSRLTSQSIELATQREQLAALEQDVIVRSEELNRQRQVLADQKREAAAAADQNSRTYAAGEKSRSELSQREAELLALKQQTLAAQAEQDRRNSELLAKHEEVERQKLAIVEQQRELTVIAEQNSEAFAAVETAKSELSRQEAELLALREQTQATQAEQDDRNSELLAQHETIERQRQTLVEQQRELTVIAEQNSEALAAVETAKSELSRQEAELLALREQTLATQAEQDGRNSELLAEHEEIERRRLALVEQQRELTVAAEQNSQAFAAVETAKSELSRQEAELLALKEQTLTTQAEQDSRNSELQAQHEEIERQRLALVEQQRELTVAAERNSQAFAAVESAESELPRREAELLVLQEQTLAVKAELDLRESAIHELQEECRTREELLRQREQQAGTAQEELLQLQQSNELRQADLQKWQSEIESRADELAHRLVVLKSYRSEQHTVRVTNETQTLATSESMEHEWAAIRKEREELDQRAAEIVAAKEQLAKELASATSITQVAESERSALLGANKELLCERNALTQLRQDLASRESGVAEREVLVARQLEDLRSRFAVLDLRAAEQKHFESEIDSRSADVHHRVQQLKKEQQAFRESIRHEQSSQESNPSASETAEELLAVRQQIEKLQEDLNASDSACAAMVTEREELLTAVRSLQKALQDVRKDVEDAHRLKSESMLLEQRLEQARQDSELRSQNLLESDSKLQIITEQLEAVRAELDLSMHERDELLAKQEEQSQISNTMVLPVNTGIDTSASRDTFSRELDQRAELLDRRDDELCERARRIEQSENDVESQRRQLLEARQQLEQARAEIQVAIRQQSVPARPTESASPEKSADSASDASHQENAANDRDGAHDQSWSKSEVSGPAADLRSELAGLFGLPKTSQPSSFPKEKDLSEPTDENEPVTFRFGPNSPRLVEASPELPMEAEAQPAREENSDDFVRDYMEQLLSRSRQTAGTVLPGELKSGEKKSEPAAASAAKPAVEPVKKTAPKVTSFIDQYMAGSMGSHEDLKPSTTSAPDAEISDATVAVEARPLLPRQKMDLQKLKENMDSFRTLSTQSVENALASHAIKVERHGFTGRTAFAAVLLTMTLVLGIANAKGAIDYPMITWVTLTSAIAILSELHRRYTSIKSHSHTRNPLELLFSSDQPAVPVPNPADMMAGARPIPPVTPASAAASCDEYDELTIIEDRFEPSAASGSTTTMFTETPVS